MEWRIPKSSAFQLVGPTTSHLQHEVYLLIALIFLTISSLKAVYGESFGTWGDLQFLSFVSLWLSRHLIFRWMCTVDAATTRSPSLKGLLVFWWTTSLFAGQYFDRPDPQVVRKQTGISHADDPHTMATLSTFLPPPIRYTWNLFRVRVWFPILAITEQSWSVIGARLPTVSFLSRKSSTASQTSLAINHTYSIWNEFWSLYGLSLQIILPLATVLSYAWYFLSDVEMDFLPEWMSSRGTQDEVPGEVRAFGAYRKLARPSLDYMLILLSCGGTLASIFLYGRIVLPFPDLVAGNNVLKAVRNETKMNAPSSTKASKTKVQREQSDVAWAEQYKSIASENRFRLVCKIMFVRLLEGIFICAILPRMGLTCRYLGHCHEGLSLEELAKILYPVGVTTPLRTDSAGKSSSTSGFSDLKMDIFTICSIVTITTSILMAQAATLNRSYLGTMGYIAGGWVVVDGACPSIAGASPSRWDARRRYKKGDLIVHTNFGKTAVYKATSNSPEGNPHDFYLRATHSLFRDELGHPSTSTVIAFCSAAQLVMSISATFLILGSRSTGKEFRSLLWGVGANLIGSYGVLRSVRPRYRELEELAKEIAS